MISGTNTADVHKGLMHHHTWICSLQICLLDTQSEGHIGSTSR